MYTGIANALEGKMCFAVGGLIIPGVGLQPTKTVNTSLYNFTYVYSAYF